MFIATNTINQRAIAHKHGSKLRKQDQTQRTHEMESTNAAMQPPNSESPSATERANVLTCTSQLRNAASRAGLAPCSTTTINNTGLNSHNSCCAASSTGVNDNIRWAQRFARSRCHSQRRGQTEQQAGHGVNFQHRIKAGVWTSELALGRASTTIVTTTLVSVSAA